MAARVLRGPRTRSSSVTRYSRAISPNAKKPFTTAGDSVVMGAARTAPMGSNSAIAAVIEMMRAAGIASSISSVESASPRKRTSSVLARRSAISPLFSPAAKPKPNTSPSIKTSTAISVMRPVPILGTASAIAGLAHSQQIPVRSRRLVSENSLFAPDTSAPRSTAPCRRMCNCGDPLSGCAAFHRW